MRIVFVCTGNTCRSVIAEYLLRQLLEQRAVDGVSVSSAGLFAKAGLPAAAAAQRALLKVGVDASTHRSQPFDATALKAGDLVFVMEDTHRRQLLGRHQVDPIAIRLLGKLAPGESTDIDDPIGGPDVAYERSVERIQSCVGALLSWLEDERISRA